MICAGDGQNIITKRVCMKQIPSGSEECSLQICDKLCKQTITEGTDVQGYCVLSDTCNCMYRCK